MGAPPPARALLGSVVVVVCLAVAACSGGGGTPTTTTSAPPETTTSTTVPLEAGEQFSAYPPALGDCFDRRLIERTEGTGGQTPVVLLLDCALPHRYEVFAVLTPPQAARLGGVEPAYPQDEVLRAFSRAECVKAFEPYVGLAYEVSELDIDAYIPNQEEWESGDRTVGCSLFEVDGGLLTGSAASSAR